MKGKEECKKNLSLKILHIGFLFRVFGVMGYDGYSSSSQHFWLDEYNKKYL